MNKRNFLKSLAGTTIGAAAAATLAADSKVLANNLTSDATRAQRINRLLPNVPLVTHEGKVVRFYDDLVKGKTVMINFMYATCGEICPGMTANLKKVRQELGDRVGKDIFMYSISLEPEHDTPEILKAYTELFKIESGWTFLTGKKEDIEMLRRHLGFKQSDPVLDKDKTQHTGLVKIGIEPLERWCMSPAMGNPKYLAEYVRWMEPNGSRPNISGYAFPQGKKTA